MKNFFCKDDIFKFCFLCTGISICRLIIDRISKIRSANVTE